MYPTFGFAKHKQGNAAVNTKRIAVGSPFGKERAPKEAKRAGARKPAALLLLELREPARHPNKHLSNNNNGS